MLWVISSSAIGGMYVPPLTNIALQGWSRVLWPPRHPRFLGGISLFELVYLFGRPTAIGLASINLARGAWVSLVIYGPGCSLSSFSCLVCRVWRWAPYGLRGRSWKPRCLCSLILRGSGANWLGTLWHMCGESVPGCLVGLLGTWGFLCCWCRHASTLPAVSHLTIPCVSLVAVPSTLAVSWWCVLSVVCGLFVELSVVCSHQFGFFCLVFAGCLISPLGGELPGWLWGVH